MTTTVTHKNNLPFFGQEELLEIADKRKFSDLIFEALFGKKPTDVQSKLFELILNISIDHGPDTPSALETISSAKNGKDISASVAAGISQINNVHGGAIEPAMELFYRIVRENLNVQTLVTETLKKGERLPGFGHRIYEIDPRTNLIFGKCKEQGLANKYIGIANNLSAEITKQKGKPIPVNIDGAIAAILCAFGWDPTLGKAVFISARTPGLCAQFLSNRK